MKITQIQTDIVWGITAANREALERKINPLSDTDMIVLPEMWSTGFAVRPAEYAEDMERCESLEWMRRMAHEKDAAIVGSLAVHDVDGTYRNRLFFVMPSGEYEYYDKHHLFSYGGEDKEYTPGQERKTVTWRGVRFLLQICYDLRFPVFSRNRGDYDAIIYVASWPLSRIIPWKVLLSARAIENQCYVIGVNRVGRDPLCEYGGGTLFINPYGTVEASCPDGEEGVMTNTLDLDALLRFRRKFPVLNDAD